MPGNAAQCLVMGRNDAACREWTKRLDYAGVTISLMICFMPEHRFIGEYATASACRGVFGAEQ